MSNVTAVCSLLMLMLMKKTRLRYDALYLPRRKLGYEGPIRCEEFVILAGFV